MSKWRKIFRRKLLVLWDYRHKGADCNSFTKYLKGKGEEGKGKGRDWNAQVGKKVQRKVVGRHGSPKEELTKERVKDFTILAMNIHPSHKPLQNVSKCLPHIRT